MPPAASLSVPPSGLQRVLGNLAPLLGGKAAAGVISLVYLVVVTHTLGVRDYGVLILVNTYVVRSMSVGLLTNLGLYPLLPVLLWQVGIDGAGWHGVLQALVATPILALLFHHDVGRARLA